MISPSQMIVGSHYTCYTQKEIELYLAKVLSSVKTGNFVVTKRKNGTNKNDAFRIKYDLKHEQIKNILLKLTDMDFCYSMLDDHNLAEVLYVFGLTENLWNTEEDCQQQVLIYIKTCYKESESFTVVISFHEAEYKLDYCFKN